MPPITKIRLISISFILFLVGTLTACGGGDESTSGSNNEIGVILGSSNGDGGNDNTEGGAPTVQGISSTTDITISGYVIDGPVIGALITVTDAKGQKIASTTSSLAAHYSVNVPAGTLFPLTITSVEGTNLVTNTAPTFNLVSAVMSAANTTANITPFSTLIVKTAQRMPTGLTAANMDIANRNILVAFNSGLDTASMPNPITTLISEQNVATIVKSSEVLAEIIRRNFSAIASVYVGGNENTLVASLAADMTDGVFDGKGSAGTDLLVSAATSVISGQVLLEALSNNLQVNETPATALMDDAIQTIIPTASESTGELQMNFEILQNAQAAIVTAALVAPSVALADIQTTITSIEVGSTSTQVAAVLPSNIGTILDQAINTVITSTESQAIVLDNVTSSPAAGSSSQTPFGGTPWAIPGKIEAEHYDEGGAGIAHSDTTIGNLGISLRNDDVDIKVSNATSGGYMISTIKGGEWLEYTVNVAMTGAYIINFRVAAGAVGRQVRVLANGVDVTGAIELPNTGGWNIWQTVSKAVNLNAGPQVLRVAFGNSTFNLDAIEILADSSAPPPAPNDEVSNTSLTLTWQPNPETLDGYIVYFGPTADAVTSEASDIKAFAGGFDFSDPTVQYDSWHDLGLQPGNNVCFKVRAYNADGISNWSQTVCGVIPQSA